jgi:hypothetical protein
MPGAVHLVAAYPDRLLRETSVSLEVAVLDDHVQVARSVGLSVDEHWEVVKFARRCGLPLLGRRRDYYSDAEIPVEELFAFQQEGLDLSLSSASTAPQPMGSQRSAALNML